MRNDLIKVLISTYLGINNHCTIYTAQSPRLLDTTNTIIDMADVCLKYSKLCDCSGSDTSLNPDQMDCSDNISMSGSCCSANSPNSGSDYETSLNYSDGSFDERLYSFHDKEEELEESLADCANCSAYILKLKELEQKIREICENNSAYMAKLKQVQNDISELVEKRRGAMI